MTATVKRPTVVVLLSGGGFTGAFQVPILERFDVMGLRPHVVYGVSVGALNGVLYAQNAVPQLRDLWAGINDSKPLFGINGFLAPAVQRWKGLYSLEPLAKKIRKLTARSDLDCVFGVGVTVRETGAYRTLEFSGRSYDKTEKWWKDKKAAEDAELHTAILGSSAIAGLMEPYRMRLGGVDATLSDGGHRHVLPPPPAMPAEDHPIEVHAVFNRPVGQVKLPPCKVDSLPEAFAWAIDTQMHAQAMADFEGLRAWVLAAPGLRRAHIYTPVEDPGSMLDASAEAIERRMAAAKDLVPTTIG